MHLSSRIKRLKDSNPLGQSLQEYGLVFGCIIAVSIIALTTLGGNINRFFQDSNQSIADEASGQPGTMGALITSLGPSAVASSQTIRLADGTIFKINRSPQSISQDVENLGTDGGTLKRLNTLDQLITSLRIQGKEDEANQLQGLSNRGHQLAQAQKLIQQSLQEAKNDPSIFAKKEVAFRGQKFSSAYELSVSLGILGPSVKYPGSIESQKVFQKNAAIQETLKTQIMQFDEPRKHTSEIIPTGTLLTSFIEEYMRAKDGNFLKNNPQADTLIKGLSQEITLVSDSLESSINYNLNKSTLGNVQGLAVDLIKQSEASSTQTDQSSKTICKTGGGQDSGLQCN
jgi:Flp pilus assembly pilin Flp